MGCSGAFVKLVDHHCSYNVITLTGLLLLEREASDADSDGSFEEKPLHTSSEPH